MDRCARVGDDGAVQIPTFQTLSKDLGATALRAVTGRFGARYIASRAAAANMAVVGLPQWTSDEQAVGRSVQKLVGIAVILIGVVVLARS